MPRLIGVVFVFVGELFARENLVLLRQESFQRRTLRKSNGPLAGMGERKQGALVVNAADHRLRFWHRETVLCFELSWKRDRRMPCHVAIPIPTVIGFAAGSPFV